MPNRRNRSTTLYYLSAVALAFGFAATLASAQQVLFVNAQASGANTGLNWADAFLDLQDALDLASNSSEIDEIWIAQGTYKPDRGTGNRSLSFVVPEGLAVYGGFAGTETSREQRDWVAHETILSGDLLDDDDLGTPSGSNCCEMHPSYSCDDSACSGVVCQFDSPCCNAGPGQDSLPWDLGCVIEARLRCGALCGPQNTENSYTIVYTDGSAQVTSVDGLTIKGGWNRGPGIVNSLAAGGISCNPCNVQIRNCAIQENGGRTGGFAPRQGQAVVADTQFISNIGDNSGGAIGGNSQAEVLVQRCLFQANISRSGGALAAGDPMYISDCTFMANIARTGGVITATASSPLITRSNFVDNRAMSGGVIHNQVASRFDHCLFMDNVADKGNGSGAAGVISDTGSARLTNCVFICNRASAGGAALVGAARFTNSLFVANQAITPPSPTIGSGRAGAVGGGIGPTRLTNCTFVGNQAESEGGAFYGNGFDEAVLISNNTIFWDNSDSNGSNEESQVTITSGSYTLDYNIVQGWTGDLPGEESFDSDPMFVDPIGPDGIPFTGDEDYRLRPGSPAINAGDPIPPNGISTDLDGHPRVLCGHIDIGPYEFGIGDFDCNQAVNLFDFVSWMPCMNGPSVGDNPPPLPSGCEAFDYDANSSIDLSDFAGWQNTYAGQ